MHPAPGIYLIHKPVGPTSFDIVKQFLTLAAGPGQPRPRPPRICHGGTLDPFASGLLLILVEPATRLFDYLHHAPKTYTATIAWGSETDTGDLHGRIVSHSDAPRPTRAQLDAALAPFLGWIDQVPPPTSNKRIAGERAYLKAHRGEEVILPPSRVYLHEATWGDESGSSSGTNTPAPATATATSSSLLRLTVRGGFYVRALVRDLGRSLGCGAHLTQLHRDSIGPYLDPITPVPSPLTARNLLPWAPVRLLTDQEIGDLRQKRLISRGDLLPPDWPLPPGFPDTGIPIRGFHRDRFCFLLGAADEQLEVLAPLRGL